MPAVAPHAEPVLTAPCPHGAAHDMAAACLAILTAMLLTHAASVLNRGQPTQVARWLCRWAAPVLRPPTPPPIAFGVDRK